MKVEKNYAFLISDSKIFVHDIFIPKRKLKGGKTDDKAVVKVIQWPDNEHKNIIGSVVDILGKTGENNAEMHAILAQYNLPYLNFNNYTKEIGLDLTKDTYDAGVHLNLSGAEKLSVYFGKYLKDNYGLTDFRNDPAVSAVYKNKIGFYDFMREDQEREIREYGALKSYGANAIE